MTNLQCQISEPVIMSAERFNEVWQYVDSVYTKLQQELYNASGAVSERIAKGKDDAIANFRGNTYFHVDTSSTLTRSTRS